MRVPTWVLYPAHAPESLEHFGPYPLSVASNVPVIGSQLPLLVISHGTGGFPFTHRDLAAQLCRAGFVVALPEHTGNSRTDNSAAHTAANLAIVRARSVACSTPSLPIPSCRRGSCRGGFYDRSLDWRLHRAGLGGRAADLLPARVAGRPGAAGAGAGRSSLAGAGAAGAGHPWFMRQGALSEVDLPILMYTGARDELARRSFTAPSCCSACAIRPGCAIASSKTPATSRFRVRFRPRWCVPTLPLLQDPPGIDRAALQGVLADEIIAFCGNSGRRPAGPGPKVRSASLSEVF